MWLLPTYKRPQLCQEALMACYETGMMQQAILFIDPPFDGYEDLWIPPNFIVWKSETHTHMAPAMNLVLERYPNEDFYGWLADDLRPRTPGWDFKLSEVAGDWDIAHCNDLWMGGSPIIRAGSLCGAFCWGGKLVRTVGWWGLPYTEQAGTDDAWICIRDPKYVPDVIVEHIHWKNQKRPIDLTDNHHRADPDMRKFYAWRDNGGPQIAISKIAEARMKERGL